MKTISKRFTIIFLALAFLAQTPPVAPQAKTSIAVYPIKAVEGVDKSIAATLTSLMGYQLTQSPKLIVIKEDMLKVVMERQAMNISDACDSTMCQVEIGKLVQAQKMVTGELSKLGKLYILTTSVIDIKTGATESSSMDRCACAEDQLIDLAVVASAKVRNHFGENLQVPTTPEASAAKSFSSAQPSVSVQAPSNLGSVVNSKYSDFAPFISANGNSLYFCSDREGGFGGQDIWVSRKGPDGQWSSPVNLGSPPNSQLNEGPDTVSVDEQTIYFTGCNRKDGFGQCDIYTSHLMPYGKWSPAENLGPKVNTKYNEANASLSFNGQTLYFVSTRPGGLGGWDIWKTDLVDQRWTESINLGPPINTPQNEFIPFIHCNEDLYFSSDGHGGSGGADIFYSKKTDTGWSDPVNWGPTINTPYNDMYFSLPSRGDWAYFSSNRKGGSGQEDLFVIPIPTSLQPAACQ